MEIVEVQDDGMQFDLNDCTQKALRQRPELVALADEANSYSRQADSVRDSWFPQTSVIGAYDYTQNEYNLNPAVTQVGVACQWTFFSSGKIRHEVAGLRDESQSKRHLHDYMQWTITLEVHQNLLNLDSERQQVVLNLEATKHAEEQVRMARRRYLEGIDTSTQVLDAETKRVEAYTKYYESVYSAALWNLKLRHSMASI